MDDETLRTPQDIVERIMAMHWDLAACQCWICRYGREMGCRVYERHVHAQRGHGKLPFVRMERGVDR